MLDTKVVKIVGKIIDDGAVEFRLARSAMTEVGIICTLVAFITKNIVIA